MSTAIVSNELEHHMFPVVRYTQVGGSAAGPTAVAGSAFTFGEGTLVTCWHCVKQPLGPDEFYGIAVRRGSIESPYEFCSIDNRERDQNGADLALGHMDWMPGRGVTLANDPVQWGERVERYGYPFPLAVPDPGVSRQQSTPLLLPVPAWLGDPSREGRSRAASD